jgi:hypothetical protein
MAVGSVSEPEYVHRPVGEEPSWLDSSPVSAATSSAVRQSGWPPGGDQRPRLGKESGDVEDVVYGQVQYRFLVINLAGTIRNLCLKGQCQEIFDS